MNSENIDKKPATHVETPAFTRAEFDALPREVLHEGRFFNATVSRVSFRGGDWVVKDFRTRVWLCRWFYGWWTVWHECRVVRRLRGIDGVPEDAFRLDRYAWVCRFITGEQLRAMETEHEWGSFFEKLEAVVEEIHQRGVVHLDLRNARNILVGLRNEPYVLDFQSAFFTGWMPPSIREALEKIDLSGVYKHWLKRAPESLGAASEAVIAWHLRNRRWWRLRGYQRPGLRPLTEVENEFLERHSEAPAGNRRQKQR